MKADRDDAPTYVRPSARRRNMTTWIVASVLGSGFTVGLLYTLSSVYMQGKVDQLANTPKPKPAPVAEITRSAPAEKDWDKIVEEVARRDTTYQLQPEELTNSNDRNARQTSFNDQNFIPRGADNVLSLRDGIRPTEQEKKTDQTKITIIKETKDTTCWPLKEGSIERRNCKSHIGLNHRN